MSNTNLNAAKNAKKDEFYTRLEDIENELRHYREHFRNKVVLCNCDDPYESNFFKYFASNFNALGLKKLIATCYNGSPILGNELLLKFDDADDEPKKIAYKVEITEVKDENGDGRIDLADVRYLLQNDSNVLSILKNGDFRSAECVKLLEQADIVVTNPPFSLFREYVAQLMKYNKKFLIIGNQMNLSYKDIFNYVLQDKIWLGYNAGDMAFRVPADSEPRATRYWQDETGQKWRSMGNICWFTNLDHKKRHEELILYETYNENKYPKYDEYDAIEVTYYKEIPCDYFGKMGVPVSFMTHYNPNQFIILGIDRYIADNPHYGKRFTINKKEKQPRIIIRRKQK